MRGKGLEPARRSGRQTALLAALVAHAAVLGPLGASLGRRAIERSLAAGQPGARILIATAATATAPIAAATVSTVAAAATWGFATLELAIPRQTAGQVDSLVRNTDLAEQMKSFNVYDAWVAGKRGLRP